MWKWAVIVSKQNETLTLFHMSEMFLWFGLLMILHFLPFKVVLEKQTCNCVVRSYIPIGLVFAHTTRFVFVRLQEKLKGV